MNSLFNACQTGNVGLVDQILSQNLNLASACQTKPNKVSGEDDEVPFFANLYALDNDENNKKIRQIFLEKGAPINYRFPDGAT